MSDGVSWSVLRHHCAAVTKPAPDFKGTAVVDNKFKEVKLADYQEISPFSTFVCPTEIIAFSDRSDEFRKLNAEIVAVSVDSHYSHLAWNNQPRKLWRPAGGCRTGSAWSFPHRSKGIVRHITINDLPVGRSVDEVLRLLNAFQFVEKHGEVCPANWEPNKPTINTKKASEYFEKNN
ncbi:hypothetical protein RGQ29_032062 [Quercus rubra]|uniref:thioredoxin-dependent peroxiredoxin n=1 Tax=Quercus rubra TaxID=3512 RepID=A0AAN7DST0_QUERU|nr:hypothetical protein RGQ29_032062 [Quercus rubra]